VSLWAVSTDVGTGMRKEHRRPIMTWSRRQALVPYAFLAPSVLALALVFFYPMMQAVGISFYDVGIGQAAARFVGLDQYRAVLASRYFPSVMMTSALWSIGNVTFVWAIGLGTALMLDRRFPFRPIVRAMFILPWAMPYVPASLVWGWMFDYEFGVLNYLIQSTGLAEDRVSFLIACPEAFFSLTGVSIWKLFPFGTVMFLAGLQTIPAEHYEAARVDGASAAQCFWHVTLPGLRNVSIMLTLLMAVWSFGRAFTIIFLLTEGGPAGCTETIVVRSYLEAFKFFHVGTASAIGVIVLAISLLFSVGYLAVAYRKGPRNA
jgi:multiple sugar transport system permease protein